MNDNARKRFARIKAIIDGKKASNTKPFKVSGTRRHRHRQTPARPSHTSNIQTKDDVKKDFLKYIKDKQSDSLESAEELLDYIDKNWDAEDIRKAFGTIQLDGMRQTSALDPKEDTKKAMEEFYLGPKNTPNGVRMAALMKLVRNMEAIKKNEKQTLKKQLSNEGKKLFTDGNDDEVMTMISNPMLKKKGKQATIGGKTRKRRRKKKRRTRKRRRTKKKRKRKRKKRRRTRK